MTDLSVSGTRILPSAPSCPQQLTPLVLLCVSSLYKGGPPNSVLCLFSLTATLDLSSPFSLDPTLKILQPHWHLGSTVPDVFLDVAQPSLPYLLYSPGPSSLSCTHPHLLCPATLTWQTLNSIHPMPTPVQLNVTGETYNKCIHTELRTTSL